MTPARAGAGSGRGKNDARYAVSWETAKKEGAVYSNLNHAIAAERHAEMLRQGEKERMGALVAARCAAARPRPHAFIQIFSRTKRIVLGAQRGPRVAAA